MADDIPDDYIAAAAAVVNAARDLDDASRAFKSTQAASLAAHIRQTNAEKRLQEALGNLTQASTGRKRES
ncbi:MAG: hypothetical protein M3458_20885 [Acidobacteriota bacterium]|nr:hypothetical protein [Acidobacteriota bacterium]